MEGGSKLAKWGSNLAKGGTKLTEGGSEFATLPSRVCYPLRIHTEYHWRIPRRNLETSKRGVRRAWLLRDIDHVAGGSVLAAIHIASAEGGWRCIGEAHPPCGPCCARGLHRRAAQGPSAPAGYRGLPPPPQGRCWAFLWSLARWGCWAGVRCTLPRWNPSRICRAARKKPHRV